jgi:hypothetical protein
MPSHPISLRSILISSTHLCLGLHSNLTVDARRKFGERLKKSYKGNELTWLKTEKDKIMLNMWERGILRKVYGAITEQEV